MTPRTPHFRAAAVVVAATCSTGVLAAAALARFTALSPTQVGAYAAGVLAVVGLIAYAFVSALTDADALLTEDGQR